VVGRNAELGERALGWPTFLPDERHFLYSRFSSVPQARGVYIGSLDAKPEEQNPTRLLETALAAQFVVAADGNGTVLYQRESTLWAQEFDTSRLTLTGAPWRVAERVGSHRAFGMFSSSSTGILVYRSAPAQTTQPTWFDRGGRLLNPVGQPFDVFGRLEPSGHPSPDAKRLAFAKFDAESVDVWVSDLERGVSQRMTVDAGTHAIPVWSPDGKQIAFSGSARSGHYDLFQVGSGDGRVERLYSSNENKFATSWSADGRFLLFGTDAESSSQGIWALPMNGSRAPFPVLHTPAAERSGVFSPDSRWIAYVSNESGTQGVYVQQISLAQGGAVAGPKVLVSREGGTAPYWRADGRELFYRASDRTVMSVPFPAGDPLHPGAPQALFTLPGAIWGATDDGSRFLAGVSVEPNLPPFTVILNWKAQLGN
jgi:eukaryotic-like serine/threonine-protein kinase